MFGAWVLEMNSFYMSEFGFKDKRALLKIHRLKNSDIRRKGIWNSRVINWGPSWVYWILLEYHKRGVASFIKMKGKSPKVSQESVQAV